MRTQPARAVISSLLLVVVLAACGRTTSGPGSPGGPSDPGSPSGPTAIPHATGAGDLVLRIEQVGGFVMPQTLFRRVPLFTLGGDGTVVTEGPIAEIYPGPALPNLLARKLTEDGVQAILRAARDAGLFGPDRAWNGAMVTDVPTTVFTLEADGKRHVVSVYALGFDDDTSRMSPEEAKARKLLARLQADVTNLPSWLPEGSFGEEHPYTATAVRVFVSKYSTPDPTLNQPEMRWPLEGSLAELGRPLESFEDTRCAVLEGDDASAVLDAARSANELTPWVSEGKRFSVLFRPLLAGESGCQDPSA